VVARSSHSDKSARSASLSIGSCGTTVRNATAAGVVLSSAMVGASVRIDRITAAYIASERVERLSHGRVVVNLSAFKKQVQPVRALAIKTQRQLHTAAVTGHSKLTMSLSI